MTPTATLTPYYPGAHAAQDPQRPALIDAASGHVITYGELNDTAWRLARILRDHGAGPGSAVTLCMSNGVDFPQVWWGAHYAGLRYAPVSPRSSVDELAYIVTNSESVILLTEQGVRERLGDALDRAIGDVTVVVLDGPDGLLASLGAEPADPLLNPIDGAPLLYSSGTTGRPKAIRTVLPDTALGATASMIVHLLTGLFGVSSDSVYLSPAPLYHAAPFGYTSAMGQIGGTTVIMSGFDTLGALAAIERYRVTHAQFVPTMFTRLLGLDSAQRERYDLSSLRCAIHAAAPCPAAVKRQMLDWWGPIIHEYYSGTEGVGFVYASPQDWLSHPGTVGRSMLGPIHIVDEVGRDLPVGQRGQVYFENPRHFEYHNDADKTAAAFHAQGWGSFGDVGHVDDDGFLYLTDRVSDMIITGGVNVYPRETELVLETHPAVHEVAVIGVPDDEFGERVIAVVHPTGGHAPRDALAAELVDYARARLAHVKCPRTVEFVDELPKSPIGKLLKRNLRATYTPKPGDR